MGILGFLLRLGLSLPLIVGALHPTTPFNLAPRGPAKKCPPFSGGDFNIDYFQLYPENADWDGDRCVVWIGYLVPPFIYHQIRRQQTLTAKTKTQAASGTPLSPFTTHTRAK